MQRSRTDQAILLMQEINCSAYYAAKQFNINQSSISRKLKLLKTNKPLICSECGQLRKLTPLLAKI